MHEFPVLCSRLWVRCDQFSQMCDTSAMMEYNVELLSLNKAFLPHVALVKIFYQSHRKENYRHITLMVGLLPPRHSDERSRVAGVRAAQGSAHSSALIPITYLPREKGSQQAYSLIVERGERWF